MALVLLASAELGVFAPVAAAESKDFDLYTLIAKEYFSGAAAGILTSGALNGNSAVRIAYPDAEDALLSWDGSKLTAQNYSSGYKKLSWIPVSYACGNATGTFSGNMADLVGTGTVDVTVKYELALTHLDIDLLQLPATLMDEAEEQKYVLDKFVDEDEPYMGYMKQLTLRNMGLLEVALAAKYFGNLNSDPQKNVALYASFLRVVQDMKTRCYDSGVEELRFYRYLQEYAGENGGLYYYYTENAKFQAELDLFTEYMNDLLGAEPDKGLTEEDKLAAAEIIRDQASGMLGAGAEIEFVELRNKANSVCERLSEPNEAINLNSSKLNNLISILESGADVLPYDGSDSCPTLRWSFAAEITVGSSGENPGGGADSGDTGDTGSGDSGSGSTGSESGSGSGSGTDSGNTGSGGSSDVDFGDIEFGSGDTASVGAADELEKYLAAAESGATIKLVKNVTLTKNLAVNCAITLKNADRLKSGGYGIELTDPSAGISADGAVKVISGVDGYRPVKAESSYTYALAEVKAPDITGEVAGDKVEKLDEIRYLFLDIDPDGITLNDLKECTAFADLKDYSVTLAIRGNDGTGLVKTADRLVVTASDSEGTVISRVTYAVVVLGDTNCNGKINTSDATATKNIGMGAESSFEARLAADVNFSGTTEKPKINSSDVSYVMAKYFYWDLNMYKSNLA